MCSSAEKAPTGKELKFGKKVCVTIAAVILPKGCAMKVMGVCPRGSEMQSMDLLVGHQREYDDSKRGGVSK